MWVKTNDPFCQSAEQLLEARKIPFKAIDVDQIGENVIKNALVAFTGQKTFPNIFVGMSHLGGLNDLKRLMDSGELDRLLKEHAIV